jgi:phage FluMu protein Com
MKIRCPKCKEAAELAPDYSSVRCEHCNLDVSYGEYVKFVSQNDSKYLDILGDYATTTEGQTAGTLDDWD